MASQGRGNVSVSYIRASFERQDLPFYVQKKHYAEVFLKQRRLPQHCVLRNDELVGRALHCPDLRLKYYIGKMGGEEDEITTSLEAHQDDIIL